MSNTRAGWSVKAGLVVVSVVAGVALTGCQSSEQAEHHKHHTEHENFRPGTETRAMAVMHPTVGNTARGVVLFEAVEGGVRVVAEIEGLDPGRRHAIHIHDRGDCSGADGKTAGGHYNPEGHDHALVETAVRHAGDLGNLTADSTGATRYEIVVKNISIHGHHNPIAGRAVIIHAKVDDGGQPTGNAGARIACGTIGLAKSD